MRVGKNIFFVQTFSKIKSNTVIYQGDALAILTNIGSPKPGKGVNHFQKNFSNTFFTIFQLQKSIYLYE